MARQLGRYEDRGLLGEGGTAQVRRVWDATLDRALAMKILRPELAAQPHAVAWFEAEAHTIARLQHPGIVPIHEIGRLPDGRPYYSMMEVGGRTLQDVLRELHEASQGGVWGTSPSGWTLRRVLEACHRAVETVAYAHACGVYHRDLKPGNVMLGAFGEVLVLDWGLAEASSGRRAPDATELGLPDTATASGVRGTVAYMPPEQARGEVSRAGPRADVYSLGATLYEVLTGQTPYRGASTWAVLTQLNSRGPAAIEGVLGKVGLLAPAGLIEIVERAMAREPEDRHSDARELGVALADWLDGARRRDEGLALVATADALLPRIASLRERAARLLEEAGEAKKALRPTQPVAEKALAWRMEDEAARFEQDARRMETERLEVLRAAIVRAQDLPEAHERLADYYRTRMATAEDARDRVVASVAETLLRAHDRGRHAAWLRGDGALTLLTDPPGAEAELYRYVEHERHLVPERVRSLGPTPLHAVTLPMGSWLVVLCAPGRPEVRYPVQIRRQEHWDGVPPGATEPLPVPLPTADVLGPDDVYVPPGWFWSGGDPEAPSTFPRRRLWADALIARRFPVTNADWITFLDTLVADGREEEALRHVPRERGNSPTATGAVIYGRDADGRFVLVKDADGDEWFPDAPVLMIDWQNAQAFAQWTTARTGQPWRLLGELEFEKVARGVDGRFLPWGDFIDPTWCCYSESHVGHRLPARLHEYPMDESPYGARHMAGNARTWCADRYRAEGPPTPDGRVLPPRELGDLDPAPAVRVWRGGSWLDFARGIRSAGRSNGPSTDRYSRLGVRLVRSWEG